MITDTAPPTVLVAEDQPSHRKLLELLLPFTANAQIVGFAEYCPQVVPRAKGLHPDVVLLDRWMGIGDGFLEIPRLLALDAPPRIIVYSVSDAASSIEEALALGVDGYMLKSYAGLLSLGKGIREAIAGRLFLAPDVRFSPAPAEADTSGPDPLAELTPAEREVFRDLAWGGTYELVAEERRLSPWTVKTQAKTIRRKLNLRDRDDFRVFARNHKIWPRRG